jgi:hypothetical protein
MERRWDLDMLRGFMLVMMFITHMPTRFSDMFGQPFGYVSAAEGFVLLSAFMAGMVYTRRANKSGRPAMRRAFFSRALKVYGCHAFLLVFLFSVIAMLGVTMDQPAMTNLIGFYLNHPWTAFPGSLLLIYNPPLLDILPLYILLLFASPLVLTWGLKRGWTGILVCSALLWLLAQFSLSKHLYAILVDLTGLTIPFTETGSFETFAWQFLWMIGLWMGASTANGTLQHRKPFPRQLLMAAAVVVLAGFLGRHVMGQIPLLQTPEALINRLFDKWHLGPLRMLDLMAMLVLVLHYGKLMRYRIPHIGFLEKLGAASLPVFCMHLAMVLVALSLFGGVKPNDNLGLDILQIAVGLTAMYATALVTLYLDKEENARIKAEKVVRDRERKERRAVART